MKFRINPRGGIFDICTGAVFMSMSIPLSMKFGWEMLLFIPMGLLTASLGLEWKA